ncbi:RHS repeat-associated core domain-containing protein [Clostridium swellfunianum]|nr:RHS repeat-associated core domain-containing protein [Clostridium swellfunianum]MCM0649718.1 RHS repeat-associated core domain-containing protein [Clostridium swellfunianum]
MFRYRYDTETGLYYLQSRYYNPEWGRFINADGLVGETGELLGHNMFAYCKNNPVNMEDPSGCWPTWNSILDAGKKLVNSVVETIKETVIKVSFAITTMIIVAAKDPDIAQAIIIPAASRGLNKVSKSFSKTFPSQKSAKKAAFRDAGIGKHGKSTPIIDVKRNVGSRHPYQGTEQIRQGWFGEKGHEVFHDVWGHKEDPFDMPHFNVYFKDGRKGHYYYPSSWDPKNNR